MKDAKSPPAATLTAVVISLAVIGTATTFLGCASGDRQLDLPPVTVTGPPPTSAVAAAGETSSELVAEPSPLAPDSRAPTSRTAEPIRSDVGTGATEGAPSNDDDTLVVIGGNLDASGAPSNREMLRAASQTGKQRRVPSETTPAIVITDENLGELAAGGRLTIAAVGSAPNADEIALMSSLADDENYWRDRIREIRQRWRDAYDAIAELEALAEGLRTRFYAADDPVRRDREIKPQWDRTLDKIEESWTTVEKAQTQLEEALDEGARAGALPGWLREGLELEPAPHPEEDDDLPAHEAIDPKILGEP
jgi:hypothetical protein